MKRILRASVALLAGGAVLLTGCAKKTKSTEKKYTWREATSSVQTWSATDWSINTEGSVLSLITIPLYTYYANETKDGYYWLPEMAADFPTDVTTEYAGDSRYGVPADAKEGWAWRIPLNKDAVWDNGEKITANDWEYSTQQFLNPNMKNYRASSLYQDGVPLANGKAYYSGTKMYDDVYDGSGYRDVPDSEMWVSITEKVPFFGASVQSYAEGDYADTFVVDGVDYWAKLKELSGGESYFKLTEEVKDALLKVSKSFGDGNPEAYKEYCATLTELEETPWENVGFVKNDDYTITLITSKPMTHFQFYYGVASLSLVKKDLYEANKVTTGNITKSRYGTSVEATASYGPYKIVDYQVDKSISLAKNENWYGYTDGKHKNMYQTTNVEYQFLTDPAQTLNLFLQGKLDKNLVDAKDAERFATSEYRRLEPQTYTYKYSFNIDRAALSRRDTPGENHSILANENFRKGAFYSVDPQKYIQSLAPWGTPGYGLLTDVYTADPDTGVSYRSTPQAKQALMDFYGVSSVEDITGYDLAAAKEYFQKAYDEEIARGSLKPTDKIVLNMHQYGGDEGYVRRATFLQDALNEGTKGTSLEGKVSVKHVTDQNYYDNMKTGIIDVAITAWGGSSMDPFGVLWCYADYGALNEYGFHPDKDTVTIELNGKPVTRTFYSWYEELCNGEYAVADFDTRVKILAENEKALLGYYNMIPVMYRNELSLESQRVVEYSDHYINSLVSFGDLPLLTYTMDDDEWAEYCAKQNNQLKY